MRTTTRVAAFLTLALLVGLASGSNIRSGIRVRTPLCPDDKCCEPLQKKAVEDNCEDQVAAEGSLSGCCEEWKTKCHSPVFNGEPYLDHHIGSVGDDGETIPAEVTTTTPPPPPAQLPQCNNQNQNAFWMSGYQGKKISELTLLGSHDAGCIDGEQVHTRGPAAWSITQTKSLHDQLCAGYRVFDIRLGKYNGHWRIWHGGSYFSDVASVGNQFQAFCNEGQGTEVAIIRLKVVGTSTLADHTDCIDQLRTAIDAGAKKCVVSKASSQTFTGDTITQLTAGVTGSAVVIMPYVSTKRKFDAVRAGLFTTGGGLAHVFNYDQNQFGKSSETRRVKNVLKKSGAGQEKKRHQWMAKVQGGEADLTFGFWMTMTGGIGALNVVSNSGKLFDNGKYKNWICKLEEKYRGKHNGLKGWTIWTDFAGDNRLESAALGGVDVNARQLTCPANTPELNWDGTPPLLTP